MNSPPVDGRSWLLSKLAVRARDVKRGVRSAASVVVQKSALDEAISDPAMGGLSLRVNHLNESQAEIFIYQLPHVGRVIEYLLSNSFDDQTFTDWVWGKLFGYGDQEIQSYTDAQR